MVTLLFCVFAQNYFLVNPNASQYHAQPQQNYPLHYESYNQINYTTNYPVQTNQFQQQSQNNVNQMYYQRPQQQNLLGNQDPAQQQQYNVTNQFTNNQNLSASASFQQQNIYGQQGQVRWNFLLCFIEPLLISFIKNFLFKVLNNSELNYTQNSTYYGMVQQTQSQQTVGAALTNATYNCATIDQSQLQQTSVSITTAQQKQQFDQTQTQYINKIQKPQSTPVNSVIAGPSTSTNYLSSSVASVHLNQQQLFQPVAVQQTAINSPVNNMHLRNHVNNNNKAQELTQQPIQQKVAPRNNEYLEQQQQQSKYLEISRFFPLFK